jgi:DNA helicase-2/ATP-dependent DNA helicase PcrA
MTNMNDTILLSKNASDNPIMNYSTNLNKAQLEAVNCVDGPLLVLAGAGTGKTKVLTSRIAHIIHKGNAFPSQVLAVTFTNKAAREMFERINREINAEGLWLGTFHSIAAKILRRHAELVGLNSNFNIIDVDDQIRLLKNILIDLNFDEKKYPAKLILNIIQKWKDLGLTPEKVSAEDLVSFAHNVAIKAYKVYQERLRNICSVDFGDLLLFNLIIFTNHPHILTEYQRKFRYILVDEYQDTNVSQYLWLRVLAQSHKNICCVGDDDQSIYGWRGAEVGNILRFGEDFPGANIVRLEQNYRSTNHILAVASNLIANNSERLGKTLWTEQKEGEVVKVVSLWDEKDEASFIAQELTSLKTKYNLSLRDIAILVRAGFQTRTFEETFIARAIPYKVIGGLRFYERAEVKDIIAYIKVSLHHDDDLALERIINTPKRGIGKATLNMLYDYGKANNLSLFRSIKDALHDGALKGKMKTVLEELITNFEKWRTLFDLKPHYTVVETIVRESGYLAMWQQDNSLEAEGRIENIKELLRALEEYNNITEFLEHISLVSDTDDNSSGNNVTIMTLHAAKGLEFDTVFLPGWEEGIFPHQRSLDEKGIAGLEEERRLAYVGITRARKRLYISFALSRRIFNQWQNNIESRFISELPEDNIERIQMNSRLHYRTSINPTPSYEQESQEIPEASDEIKLGRKVFHEKFGYGKVISISGDRLEISFHSSGIKKILKSFVKLA